MLLNYFSRAPQWKFTLGAFLNPPTVSLFMARRFYLDTSIWRDYFESRSDGIRPLGALAFQFLKECTAHRHSILVSDIVVHELRLYFPKEAVDEMFSSFEDSILRISASRAQHAEARKEWLERDKCLPLNDVLHAVIAKHNKAVLIARDRHFFEMLSSIADVRLPEEVTFD